VFVYVFLFSCLIFCPSSPLPSLASIILGFISSSFLFSFLPFSYLLLFSFFFFFFSTPRELAELEGHLDIVTLIDAHLAQLEL
jgi:hypothetical protein